MCGIAGFNWRDDGLVSAMLASLRHRGPDDEGTFVDDDVSLGHRRLSILDLSPLGHQPMVYERAGRRAIVTYNGEIFNFREVRQDLLARGYRFVSESDTELLLAAYLEWGAECVTRFNGMWAFALYEPGAHRLLLSRDRFGEKPLHYRLADGSLIFASEIKAILAHPVPRRANAAIVSEYLYKGRAQGGVDSFFEGIRMLPPAHNAVFDLRSRRLALERYYQPRRGTRRVGPDEFRTALETAVRRRLVSDVPVSISLSSGTDSTSVAALMARLTDSRIKAFSTATNGADGERAVGDETALLRSFLDRYARIDLAKSSLSEASFGDHYREIIYHMDEPFARQSAYVRWEIAHLTHTNRYKVLLNGEGADEVLGGYISFAPRFLSHLVRNGHPLRLAREVLAVLTHPERARIVAAARENAGRHRREERERAELFRRKYSIVPVWREDAPVAYADIKDFLDAQVHDYSLPRLLVCNDKMSMANSVEGRAPFLDHEFVDLAFSMDPTRFVVGGSRKFPLREAMRGLVPDQILFRRNKDAFNAPIFEYLRNDTIRARVQDIFREPRTAAVFDPRAYVAEYERFLSRRAADRAFLLHGLFLEEWARTFDVAFA